MSEKDKKNVKSTAGFASVFDNKEAKKTAKSATDDEKKVSTGTTSSTEHKEKTEMPVDDAHVIDDLKTALSEAKEQLLRAKAELENQRRRSTEEIQNAHKYAAGKFARDLLGVKDALEMALADQSQQFDMLKMGVDLTLKELVSAFEKANITTINPAIGEPLDPHRHQAISTEIAEGAPNSIIRVMQKGYAIADRILRPAMVIVSKELNNTTSALENTGTSHDLSTGHRLLSYL